MSNFIKHGKASVVIDGQFGSTGKGLAAAYQCEKAKDVDWKMVICTTNAAPNAGHTTVMPDGRKFVTFHLPTMAVIHPEPPIYLNAGAIIDIDMLQDELGVMGVDPGRVSIHPNAAVITEEDKEYERQKTSGATQIASTQKGVGRALARKIMREGVTAKDCRARLRSIGVSVGSFELNEAMLTGYSCGSPASTRRCRRAWGCRSTTGSTRTAPLARCRSASHCPMRAFTRATCTRP